MKLHYKDKTLLLIGLDGLAGFLAFFLALAIRYEAQHIAYYYAKFLPNLLILTGSIMFVHFVLDLYSLHKMSEGFAYQAMQVGIGVFISAVIASFALYLQLNIIPRTVFALFFLLVPFFIVLFRRYFSRFALSTISWRVLVVGDRSTMEMAHRLLSERKYLHSRIVGYVSDEDAGVKERPSGYLGPVASLPAAIRETTPDQVVVALPGISKQVTYDLLNTLKSRIKVGSFCQFVEAVAEKVPLEHVSDSWFVEQIAPLDKRYFWFMKRTTDILLCVIGLCLALPLMPFIALLIVTDTPGPVFYTQTRIGRDGKPFTLWKFRTMVLDADRNNVHWTNHNDERITRFGKVLRKVHLDELPQLYNILKGDMSFVGPRPEAISLVERYQREIPYYPERHMVTPGITGWAQINHPYGNSVDDAREKLKYDLYYIKNRNLILDAIILLRTIRIVATGKGAL